MLSMTWHSVPLKFLPSIRISLLPFLCVCIADNVVGLRDKVTVWLCGTVQLGPVLATHLGLSLTYGTKLPDSRSSAIFD
jgi:hypothetical protein